MINLDFEIAVLNCAIMFKGTMAKLIGMVRKEFFTDPEHSRIWEILECRFSNGEPIDPILLSKDVAPLKIAELTDLICDPVHHQYYAIQLREKYFVEDIKKFGGDISNVEDFERAVHRFNEKYEDVNRKFETSDVINSRPLLKSFLDEVEKGVSGKKLDTGLRKLDFKLGGIRAGYVLVVAGRTSMGKTDFVMNLIWKLGVLDGLKVAVFSLEMTNSEVTKRIVALESGFNKSQVNQAKPDNLEQLINQTTKISDSDIMMCDIANITPSILRAKIEIMRGKMDGLDCVLIDYIQLMQPGEGTKNRAQDLGIISRSLKRMAKEFEVPFMVVAQLNRMPEGRSDNRPRLSDIRESGDIEQDADAVLLLYRESYYNPESESNICEIIIAKNRSGEVGIVNVKYDPAKGRFSDLSYLENLEPAFRND